MNDNTRNVVITLVFILVIVMGFIVNLFKEDTLISVTERRKLSTFPQFSINKLLDKSFINQFEKYANDQFIKRDELRKLKTNVELEIFRKKDMNNVYEYQGNIIKQEYPLNEKSVLNVAQKMNIIKEKYLDESNNIYYSIIPDKNYFVNDEYLKMDYSKLQQIMEQNLQGFQYINIFDCLKLEDYYCTDTHWKQECLENVFEKIATTMNFRNRIKNEFFEQEIAKFDGVYAGQLQVKTNQDAIKIMTNDIINQCKVYNFETKEETGIYNFQKLNGIDKYDVFLSGATPLLEIKNNNSETDKELIVFRDSYGSSLIPLFAEAYKKITVVDTRYIATQYLENYIDFSDKDVLFIYSTLVINSSFSLK